MTVEHIKQEIAPLREELLNHSLYNDLESLEHINIFMEQHIYAVWDFMSMVKWLQRKLTCTEVPWVASKANGQTQRFINEIVLAEETDTDRHGEIKSHFQMYVDAMEQSGADPSKALDFIKSVNGKKDVVTFLKQNFLPGKVIPFLDFTFGLLQEGKAHKIAAAFTFGREDLIPDMFLTLVKKINQGEGNKLDGLIYYMERHIEIDGEEHGPMSLAMVSQLCGKNEKKWDEAMAAAKEAFQARMRLWTGIQETIAFQNKNMRVMA